MYDFQLCPILLFSSISPPVVFSATCVLYPALLRVRRIDLSFDCKQPQLMTLWTVCSLFTLFTSIFKIIYRILFNWQRREVFS